MKRLFKTLCLGLALLVLPISAIATVSSTASKIIYVGDNSTVIFPYTFKIFNDTELVVTEVVTESGDETDLVLNTGYTVAGVGDAAGGTITVTDAPLTTEKLVIRRVLSITQGMDLVDNIAFSLESLETAHDKVIMIAQQFDERLDRVITGPITNETPVEFPSPESNKLIGWNEAATALENKDGIETTLAAAEAAQVAAEAAAAAAAAAMAILPDISGGDEGNLLTVDSAGTAYELDGNKVRIASGATTYAAVQITANSLTTGSSAALGVSSTSTNASTRQVVEIVNGSTAAVATTALRVVQYGNGTSTQTLGVENYGQGIGLNINSTTTGPHMRLTGDPTAGTYFDGSIWYTGSELNFMDGATTKDLLHLTDPDYDSEWFSVANNNSYTKTHGLGGVASFIYIDFNTAEDDDSGILENVQMANYGMEITGSNTTTITVVSGVTGVWANIKTGGALTSGYCRIRAWK